MEIYTSTIYGVKKLKLDSSFTVMDITVKSKDRIKPFAPSWDIVKDWKAGNITKKCYTDEYIRLMRISYNKHREEWINTLKHEKIVLCCYCHSGEFCHRYILVKLLLKVAEHLGIRAKYCGELGVE